MILDAPAVLALAIQCVGPALAPVITGVAMHESSGDTTITHRNPNGTIDAGLAQVNSSNFGWLGMTMQTAMDPCKNLEAGLRVLFVRYNGNPPPEVAVAYSSDVMHRISVIDHTSALATTTVQEAACPKADDDGWRTPARPRGCPDGDDTPVPGKDKE